MSLQVRLDGNEFYARLSLDRRREVAFNGFKWDEIKKRWATGSPKAAYRFWEECDPASMMKIIDELGIHAEEEIQSFEIAYPHTRRTPFYHQVAAAKFILTRKNSYIAHEPGLGKTALLPLCMNTRPGKALVLCPSFLKLNWEDELEVWLNHFQHIQILKQKSDKIDPKADIHIVPDSLIHSHEFREQFMSMRYEYLFLDEAHRYKNPEAKRTMSLLGARSVKLRGRKERLQWKGLHRLASRTVALSGTPMPNRPLELFALISRLAPHAVNYYDKHRFGVRYCAGHAQDYGWDYNGASNLDELNKILTRDFMQVRRLRDCVDMPEKIPPKIVFIDDDRTTDLKGEEMKLMKSMKLVEIVKLEVERSIKFRDSVADKLEDRPDTGAFGFISELRKILGLRKVRGIAIIAEGLLEDHNKIAIGVWHKEVAHALVKALGFYDPLLITGETPMESRHLIVRQFQNDIKERVIIGTIGAMGVGLTLTKATAALIGEPSYVPGENDQFFARFDRIGQEETFRPYYAAVKNSLDHLVINADLNKRANIVTVIR